MTQWIETYRGVVAPWECDVVEHFTIAYYFDRLADAVALLGRALGLPELESAENCPCRMELRFLKELRAGSSFHILSGPLAVEQNELRLAHRFVDSASGESLTWVEQKIPLSALTPQLGEKIAGRLVSWEGPALEARPEPKTLEGFRVTARDRVKPADLNANGSLTWAGFVHRFACGLLQALAAIGVTAEYTQEKRRAYSTFELKLAVSHLPRLGAGILVEGGILYLGGSSLRFLHRMTDAESGEELARLGQFGVLLDLDARRPARWSPEIRETASGLIVPMAE